MGRQAEITTDILTNHEARLLIELLLIFEVIYRLRQIVDCILLFSALRCHRLFIIDLDTLQLWTIMQTK